MKNSAQGIEIIMALITIITIFFAVFFQNLKTKRGDIFGNNYPKAVITKASNFWWSMSLYFIIQGVTAASDNLAFIGFGYISTIPSLYYFSQVLTYHVSGNELFNAKNYIKLCFAVITFSGIIFGFKIDYLSWLNLYNSHFTSYVLPISLVAIIPLLKAVTIFYQFGTYRFKPATYHTYFVLFFAMASVIYFALCRPNPAHTFFGYSSAFLLYFSICIGIADALFHELRGYTKNQINFSNLELLSNAHDQGKKVKNAIFLIQEFNHDPKNNEKFLEQAINILNKVSLNFSKIESRTRLTINSLRKAQDTITMREIKTGILKEYETRALKKQVILKIEMEEFLADQTFFLINKDILIESIVNNLIDNSIKFSGPNEHVTVLLSINEKNYLTIIVEDQCGGIPSKVIQLASKYISPDSELGTLKELGVGRGLISMFYHLRLIGGEIEIKNKNKGMYAKIILSNSPLINLAPQEQFLPKELIPLNDTPPAHH